PRTGLVQPVLAQFKCRDGALGYAAGAAVAKRRKSQVGKRPHLRRGEFPVAGGLKAEIGQAAPFDFARRLGAHCNCPRTADVHANAAANTLLAMQLEVIHLPAFLSPWFQIAALPSP